MTTTGFCTEDYNLWPSYARMVLLCLMFIGACGGSTGGGMKVSRLLILIKFAQAQIYRCFYPHAVTNVRLDDHRVSDDIITRILGFFFIYLILFVGVCLLICLIEPGLASMAAAGEIEGAAETAITASVATLSNIGPGLSGIGPTETYAWLAPQTKLLLIFSMLTGRLEVYTVIVLLLPNFWKR
ncbi:MAG: potassium transporter TrkG [Lentisphaeria bacterium]|nr:potassium transporter TrkG [Lentisphaeria bacterium]